MDRRSERRRLLFCLCHLLPRDQFAVGLPVGPEPPSISRREGRAMGNDSAAPRLDLAFQG